MSFGAGETRLSEWMARNAYVCWTVHPEPWALERHIIETIPVPLNVDGNRHSAFREALTECRSRHKTAARALPVLK